jgi:hypothetical protein
MNPINEIDPELRDKFALLQSVQARKPENAEKGRIAFLQQVQEIAKAVTPLENRRHKGWMHALQQIFMTPRKELSPMFGTLATVVVIVMLVLGGGGTTVAAAQSSYPDQPLYALKLWSEDLRLRFTADPQAELQLALEFTARRADEIRVMVQNGSVPPGSVQTRYQSEVEQAIRIAASFPDGQAVQALEQVRSRLQTQQEALLKVRAQGSTQAEASLLRSREMIQERLQWVEEGLKDPIQLRDQLRQRDQLRDRDPLSTSAPAGQATQAGQPATGNGNPWTTGTPTPGSGYGPGPGSGNPWTTGTPTPGSGYGPGLGPDPTRTCTPGSGDGPGPQPTQRPDNQPTQAGPQPTQKGPGPGPTQVPPSDPPGPQPTTVGPGPQPTSRPGNPGGGH